MQVILMEKVANLGDLVLKPANESGGYGILIGNRATAAELDAAAESSRADPRNWVAQPILDLSTAPTLVADGIEPRHLDLRPFILTGEQSYVTAGGLTAKSALKTLFETSAAEASFTVETGELINVDVVRAIQSPATGGTRGGKTKFDSLTGSVSINSGRYTYKHLQMTSGPLNANGSINVGGDGSIAGRLNAELGSKGLVVARGSLGITGSIRDPLLRP